MVLVINIKYIFKIKYILLSVGVFASPCSPKNRQNIVWWIQFWWIIIVIYIKLNLFYAIIITNELQIFKYSYLCQSQRCVGCVAMHWSAQVSKSYNQCVIFICCVVWVEALRKKHECGANHASEFIRRYSPLAWR